MNKNRRDYIKVIYELGGYKTIVTNKRIAKALGVSYPSVSEMIKKLRKDGYLEYLEYKGVSLTEKGIAAGRKIRRRYLLWEVFLVDKLNYSLEEVYNEARELEYITSDKLEFKLDEYLGYPKFCPHGLIIESNYKYEQNI